MAKRTNFKEEAKEFLTLQLNPVPVKKGTKIPIRKEHQTRILEEEIDEYNWNEIGISTGYASNNLGALDFDLKNSDDPKKFLKDYSDLVGKDLLDKLVVQKTPSGGFHFIYRCDMIESSTHLAKNEEGLAILETRELGSYIKCYPSEGYELVKKDFTQIPYLTPQERFNLFVAGRKLNQLIKKDSSNRISKEQKEYRSKFPEYDDNESIGVELLEKHGWTIHSEIAGWINMTRPDKSVSDGMSGGYNIDGKFFYAFSTSQNDFDIERPYSNSQIYAQLECGGNYKKAYAKLFEAGHGVESEESEEVFDFMSDEIEENSYLTQVLKGEIELGLTTGFPSLDPYFRFKRNDFAFILGLENIGKSFFLNTLQVAGSILHGFKFGLVAPENSTATNRRRSMEAAAGKNLENFTQEEYQRHLKYSRQCLKIVANKEFYSLEEVLEIGKKLFEEFGIDYLIIDPINAFRIDSSNEYAYYNEILSRMRLFTENYCGIILVGHVYSQAARSRVDNKTGYMVSPNRFDTQMGNTIANKISSFLTLHRVTNHQSDLIRRTLQITVEKIKDVSTGGSVHNLGEYSELLYEENDSFLGYWDNGVNPIYRALLAKKGTERLTKAGAVDSNNGMII